MKIYRLLNLETHNSKESLVILFCTKALYVKDLDNNYIEIRSIDALIDACGANKDTYWGFDEEVEFGYLNY